MAVILMIFVCSLNAVESTIAEEKPSHLISVLDAASMIETPEAIAGNNHLKLAMNDISTPRKGYETPGEAHIASLITFLEDWPQVSPLLIHCWAGISRSTAAAFIAFCLNNPDQDEFILARMLRHASPSATPNKLIVHLADNLLGRNGRMVNAIEEIGRGASAWQGSVFSLPLNVGNPA